MHCAEPSTTGIDIYMGIGGAPEGVLAAAALKCMGGQIYGRLIFRNDDEKARAIKAELRILIVFTRRTKWSHRTLFSRQLVSLVVLYSPQ